jgi:hypothetical protein
LALDQVRCAVPSQTRLAVKVAGAAIPVRGRQSRQQPPLAAPLIFWLHFGLQTIIGSLSLRWHRGRRCGEWRRAAMDEDADLSPQLVLCFDSGLAKSATPGRERTRTDRGARGKGQNRDPVCPRPAPSCSILGGRPRGCLTYPIDQRHLKLIVSLALAVSRVTSPPHRLRLDSP